MNPSADNPEDFWESRYTNLKQRLRERFAERRRIFRAAPERENENDEESRFQQELRRCALGRPSAQKQRGHAKIGIARQRPLPAEGLSQDETGNSDNSTRRRR